MYHKTCVVRLLYSNLLQNTYCLFGALLTNWYIVLFIFSLILSLGLSFFWKLNLIFLLCKTLTWFSNEHKIWHIQRNTTFNYISSTHSSCLLITNHFQYFVPLSFIVWIHISLIAACILHNFSKLKVYICNLQF